MGSFGGKGSVREREVLERIPRESGQMLEKTFQNKKDRKILIIKFEKISFSLRLKGRKENGERNEK